jgi:hypothetical protein
MGGEIVSTAAIAWTVQLAITVPTIVPDAHHNSASRADASQIACSEK